MGDAGGQTAKSGHLFRLHEHVVGLLEVFLDLLHGPQIGEDTEGGDLLILVIDDAAGKTDRDGLAVPVLDHQFMAQQFALAAVIIAAHPLDELVGDPFLVQTGDMQIR